jgi:hypothetical protein|nr:MAG TPA: hypothetical protein [Caudoviricetes sp.]
MFGKKKEVKEKKDFTGLTIYTALNHVTGLPLVEDVLCEIFSYPDRLEFKAGTTEIKLSKDKITDMRINTETEIQNQKVSSVGGAVAGAMLFGGIGAVIGGRAKNKKVKNVSNYLIISYNSDGELKHIVFDTQHNHPMALNLVKEFTKSGIGMKTSIEL